LDDVIACDLIDRFYGLFNLLLEVLHRAVDLIVSAICNHLHDLSKAPLSQDHIELRSIGIIQRNRQLRLL
jgi:stage III sporulation protein SpoIIIAA